jgi:hypothetical protein
MPNEEKASLLAGRRTAPLSNDDVKKVANLFLSLDPGAPFRFDPTSRTCFRTFIENGEEVGEIVFGPDIFPGTNIVDPNSSLGVRAAAGHELAHYYRWLNKTQLDGDPLMHLDEAMTSLDAILRFQGKLQEHDVNELVRDALKRLHLYLQNLSNQ